MGKKILIIIGIILGLAVAVGGFWYVKKQANNEQLIKVFKEIEEREEKIDTSDWKTYRNEKYGFQINYPEDWDIFVKDYSELSFLESTKKGVLDSLAKFIIISPDYPRHTSEPIKLHIVKDCNLEQLREKNTPCSNSITISVHKKMGSSCAQDKTKNGQLSVTVSEAFHDIFTLKEGEYRESLQYNKQSSCFIYDGTPRCVYRFVNDITYLNDESCYSIDIKDSTKERTYLEAEEAILESLNVVRKKN